VVLVDTSLWVLHLRSGHPHLEELLARGEVVTHPFVIGELACGKLKNRGEILALLEAIPQATMATHEEVLGLIEDRKLMGCGLGYVDVHLLASAFLTPLRLWTNDQRLKSAAFKLGVGYAN
jgi:predicted nucleic acid-binding protein